MKQTLKSRIYSYFRSHPNERILSVQIERLTFNHTKHVGSTGSRAVRSLYAEGKLKREGEGKLMAYWYEPNQYEKFHQQMQLDGMDKRK